LLTAPAPNGVNDVALSQSDGLPNALSGILPEGVRLADLD
jgi:hypothetical protein